MNNFGEVIVSYTDAQALEDGVLVAFPGPGKVNRVTRSVFDHFTNALGSSPVTGTVTDITPVMEAIRAILAVPADEDGWRKLTYREKELWLLPNETGGYTLMFPGDY